MEISRLYEKKEQLVKEMRGILNTCEAENREMTADEQGKFDALDKELDNISAKIKMVEKVEKREAELDRPVRTVKLGDKEAREKSTNGIEFRDLGDFLATFVCNPYDERIRELRTQSMKEGTAGGIMVPEQYKTSLMSLESAPALIRPRAYVIPAGNPPDASITMPALDQTSGANMYGGVAVSWIGEGEAKPETSFKLREITLEPKEVAAYIPLTDKLLRNWQAAGNTAETLLKKAIVAAEETAFISGTGVGQPLGIINDVNKAAIVVNRASAGQISKADVDNMFKRIYEDGGEYVWIASPTVKSYLMAIADAGNFNLWLTNYAQGLPPTLLGAPILWSQRSPGLGNKGDLMLVNLKNYIIKDGSGPFVAMSEHVYFTSNKTVIKVFWNVDGKPWLTEPIALEGSPTDTLSPFVILK